MSKCYYCNGKSCTECKKKKDPSPNETLVEVKKPTKPKWYGFTSNQYLNGGGNTVIYSRPDGSEVEVCWILNTTENNSGWKDAKYLGEVVEFIRQGRTKVKESPY